MGNFASTNSTFLYVNSLFALGYTTAQLTRKKLFENEELNRPNLTVLCDAANTNNVQKQETSVWTHFKSRSDSNCAFLCSFAIWCLSEETNWGEHGQDQDWISCRILAIFLDQDWIWIFIFEKNWIRTGSGYLFDFYNEIFLRMVKDVTNDGAVVFFAIMIFILKKYQNDFVSTCCTHHNRCKFVLLHRKCFSARCK